MKFRLMSFFILGIVVFTSFISAAECPNHSIAEQNSIFIGLLPNQENVEGCRSEDYPPPPSGPGITNTVKCYTTCQPSVLKKLAESEPAESVRLTPELGVLLRRSGKPISTAGSWSLMGFTYDEKDPTKRLGTVLISAEKCEIIIRVTTFDSVVTNRPGTDGIIPVVETKYP